jgi:hypothetical protein
MFAVMQTRSHLPFCRKLFWVGLAAFALAIPALAQKAKPASPASEKPIPAQQAKPCPVPLPPEGTHRLIMKDGSYQSFSKCEVAGERVRYLSAERYEWEEVPNSLVDWKATEQYEQASQAGELPRESERVAELESEAERRAQAPAPAVASGVHLPDASGVFLLDSFQGKPELVELLQNGGEINQERGRNVLRAALNPFAGSKQSIELKGARAQVQVHVLQPVIYLNLEAAEAPASGSAESSGAEATAHAVPALANRYRIARLSRRKDSRVIGNLKVAFTGKLSQQQELVPSTAELFSPPWVKLAPLAPLPPGEYAVVEMLGEKEINLYVWDFGVDPGAPESTFVWRDAPAPESGKDEAPALTNRPKK